MGVGDCAHALQCSALRCSAASFLTAAPASAALVSCPPFIPPPSLPPLQDAFYRQGLPNMMQLLATAAVFCMVVYFQVHVWGGVRA